MSLLQKILESLPELNKHKEELEPILHALQKQKPNPPINDALFEDIKKNIYHTVDTQHLNHFNPLNLFPSMKYALLIPALALVILPVGYALVQMNIKNVPSSLITRLEPQAFGSLVSLESTKAFPDMSSTKALLNSSINATEGMGGNEMSPIRIGEPYPMTHYTFRFDGDLSPYLTESSGTVYKRQSATALEGSGLKSIPGFAHNGMLSVFAQGDLTNMTLRKDGYYFTIDSQNNSWTIYEDWQVSNKTMSETWEPLQQQDIPADDAIIAVARNFAQSHGIDLASYESPVIAEPELALARIASTSTMYAPDIVSVVFPSLIDGQRAYLSWGLAPTGLRISVNLRTMNVTHAFDVINGAYDASSYTLVQDAKALEGLIAGGGSVPMYPPEAEEEVIVELSAPEKILMEHYIYDNDVQQTLYVPALRFSLKDPTQIPWMTSSVTIPLVQEIVNGQIIESKPMPLTL